MLGMPERLVVFSHTGDLFVHLELTINRNAAERSMFTSISSSCHPNRASPMAAAIPASTAFSAADASTSFITQGRNTWSRPVNWALRA
jgi:hypothetical protein